MTLASYFARVMAWFLAFAALPILWWYYPKALLVVIRLNTALIAWVIQKGVSNIPDPQIERYVRWALKPGEWFQWGLNRALTQVPEVYRDHVEVLARLRYDPGAWMVLGELATVLFTAWLVWCSLRERRKLRQWRRDQLARKEPHFTP